MDNSPMISPKKLFTCPLLFTEDTIYNAEFLTPLIHWRKLKILWIFSDAEPADDNTIASSFVSYANRFPSTSTIVLDFALGNNV
jgi:hypothetical protein